MHRRPETVVSEEIHGQCEKHETFLVLWLSRHIFPYTCDSIWKLVFSIVVHVAGGNRIAPAVLASIYRDMT
ncbi:hypothetical protein SADUNF_Sadunf16G0283500 [Salix dunnii]|uniref:Aminotransferase-like plant mobile domain-containing protein n=1 Tax=Salix dunnii TaxID=1413687 RepID=A0A835MN12_9ROSI|nr:hypothetical protein SADUNF_Sadunf16G0283500 [Salix dunnii]